MRWGRSCSRRCARRPRGGPSEGSDSLRAYRARPSQDWLRVLGKRAHIRRFLLVGPLLGRDAAPVQGSAHSGRRVTEQLTGSAKGQCSHSAHCCPALIRRPNRRPPPSCRSHPSEWSARRFLLVVRPLGKAVHLTVCSLPVTGPVHASGAGRSDHASLRIARRVRFVKGPAPRNPPNAPSGGAAAPAKNPW